jgi:hypothetical protein
LSSTEPLHDLANLTSAWLTAALAASGALEGGAVESFTVEPGGGNWSANARLRLRYTPDARGERPERLFLKLVRTYLGDGESFGPSEVDYYTRDYVDLPDAPLVRCYHAAYSPVLRRYHLLLDDHSATHVVAATKAPTLGYGLALAEALATLHARWWGATRLAEAGAPVHGAEQIQHFVDIAAPGAEHIITGCAAELQPHWPTLLRDLFARYPQALIERTRDLDGFTLIHGDTGDLNILVPRAGDQPLYLIDRQPFDWSLTTWLGVYDLAYAMVLDWAIATRRDLEGPVLRRYHDQLLMHGTTGYAWERLWEDYRLVVPLCVAVAAEYCRGGVNSGTRHIWLPMLQRALTACDDLVGAAHW